MERRKKLPDTRLPDPRRVILYVVIWLNCLPVPAWSSEASLRVAFVYNFIKFINWPANKTSRFHLCALRAEGDTQAALLQLNGKQVNKKSIDVTFLEDQSAAAAQITACQLVYRPANSAQLILPHPLPFGVLLVADDPYFGEPDVGIALLRGSQGRIEFDINQAAVAQAGVSISSQLLKLAKNDTGG